MNLGDKIMRLTTPLLTDEHLFVVGITVSALQGPQKVTVILDGDHGVTIDNCADLSRALSEILETEGLIGDNFTLEVTTPGIDKPLQLKRQYVKNAGRNLKVYLRDKSVTSGKLTEVQEDNIVIEQETGEGKKKEITTKSISLSDIEKTFVQVSFK